MKTGIPVASALTLLIVSGSAIAEAGKVTIMSVSPSVPYDNDKIVLSYEAVPGPEGDHLHLNVDGKRVDIIHQLKGTAEVHPLPSGKHHICLAINTKAHVPTGVESCVDVTVW